MEENLVQQLNSEQIGWYYWDAESNLTWITSRHISSRQGGKGGLMPTDFD